MAIKTSIGIILFLIIKHQINGNLLTENNRNKFSCPDSTECSCGYLYSEYELNCPVSNPSITIKINPDLRLQMDCDGTIDENKYSILPQMSIGDIPTVQITRCPLPRSQPIVSILEHLGIRKIRALFFRSYGANLGMTLVNQHLKGLSDLERLYLSGNGLTDLTEDLFHDVANLTWLDLQGNKVHLPRNIFVKLDKLEYLELGYNNLEHLEPGVFRNQNRLKLLNLWGNKLQNLKKESFDGLISIRELDLSSSEILSLESNVFALLPNLTNLNLSANKFTTLPTNLFINNTKLQRLKLVNNRVILAMLPFDFLNNLTNLEEIIIQHTGLINMPNNLFSGSINLKNITLSNNKVQTLSGELFEDQTKLLDLDLSNNQLTQLDNNLFKNTRELIVLKLSYNQLMNISEIIFQQLRNLKELYINNNNLQRIHQNAFVTTDNIKILSLDNNHLSFMDKDSIYNTNSFASPFQHLRQLQTLGLRNNSITIIFQDWYLLLNELRELDLSYNNISGITYIDLQFQSRNIIVNLTNNNIFEINLRELEIITFSEDDTYLDKKSIEILLDSNPLVCNCVILHFIQYLNNQLSQSAQKTIQLTPGNLKCVSPPKLENVLAINVKPEQLFCSLDSKSSSIKLCPQNCECLVRSLDNVVIITCANLNLTTVPTLPDLSQLKLSYIILHIENNSIIELPSKDATGYLYVREIYAQNNSIKDIQIENIPRNLTILNLANNNIETLNSSVLNVLNKTRSLRQISLGGSPWTCDCNSLDLLLFVQKHYKIISDYSNLKCSNGGKMASLQPSDFCPEDKELIIALSVTIAVLGLIIGVLCALYYKYQQEVKVWLYAHNLCLWFVTEKELDKDKKFDAFISYSHKDEEFVTDKLVPTLESGPNPFKLCLHIRDWIVGEWIPTQIAKSVEESRRTVVILSPNFLESVWGRMEFRAAHNNALSEGRARVIVIIYGDIGDTSKLDPELKAYLNMNTYVKWGDPWFWDKLRYAMPHTSDLKLNKSLFKNDIRSSVDDKLELIMPSPSTPPLTTPPAEIAGTNPLVNKLNCDNINQNNSKLPNGLNGHVNGAFIINTNSKQSDV